MAIWCIGVVRIRLMCRAMRIACTLWMVLLNMQGTTGTWRVGYAEWVVVDVWVHASAVAHNLLFTYRLQRDAALPFEPLNAAGAA